MELLDAEAVAAMVSKTVGGADPEPGRGSSFERGGQLARLVARTRPAEQAAGRVKSSTLTPSSSYVSSSTGSQTSSSTRVRTFSQGARPALKDSSRRADGATGPRGRCEHEH